MITIIYALIFLLEIIKPLVIKNIEKIQKIPQNGIELVIMIIRFFQIKTMLIMMQRELLFGLNKNENC